MLVFLFTSRELCCLKLPAIKTEPAHPVAFFHLFPTGRQMEFLSPTLFITKLPFFILIQKKNIFFFFAFCQSRKEEGKQKQQKV